MQELFEKYKTDQQYRAKIKLCIYGIFILIVTIYAISLNNKLTNKNTKFEQVENISEEQLEESPNDNSLVRITPEMEYETIVSIDNLKYKYLIKKDDKKEYITKIINNETEEYLYEQNNYFKKQNNNYEKITKKEIDNYIDYDYLRLETINLYINKGIKNNNDYLVYVKDIIIGNNSEEYFIISYNNDKIFIDYTPLLKIFNKELKTMQLEIIIKK